MNSRIHPELRSIKARRIPLNRFGVAALHGVLSVVNAIHRRKFAAIARRTIIIGADHRAIPVWLIRPEQLAAHAPVLVYFHGGAFVMKPAPQHFENAVRYARESGCLVVFVEYRLAPRYPFPAGFNDCYAALRWTIANANDLNIDTGRIVVGGDSAGGGLAAGVAQRAWQEERIALRGQLLVYPCVDLFCTRPSSRAFADFPPIKGVSTDAIAKAYLGHPFPPQLPQYASPLYGDVTDVAPAYVEVCELDRLHDQGAAYATALADKGVAVEVNEIERAIHGFDLFAPSSSVKQEAMRRRIQFLRRMYV